MGKGNKTKVDTTADYKAAVTATKEKTPGEKLLEEQSAKTLGWAAKGDFRNPREGGLFVNYADPALLHEHRALMRNAGGQGIYGLGTADPNYLASVKEVQDAENERADAGQYEADIREGIGSAAGAAGSAEGADLARKATVLGVTSDMYRNESNKPKWWQMLLSSASQIGAGWATSGFKT